MSLLAGIISAAGEPVKISSFASTTSSGSDSTTPLTLAGTSSGNLQIVVHYVNGTQTAPSTPSNFTSLKSGAPRSSFGYRISYRIYSSTVSTFTLPTPPAGTAGQVAVGLTLFPLSGFSFSGLTIADEVTQDFASSASIQNQLNANKNDIGLGILYSSGAIQFESGTTLTSYWTGQANGAGTRVYAGVDPKQSSGTVSIGGNMELGPCMYLLQVLRPTFA